MESTWDFFRTFCKIKFLHDPEYLKIQRMPTLKLFLLYGDTLAHIAPEAKVMKGIIGLLCNFNIKSNISKACPGGEAKHQAESLVACDCYPFRVLLASTQHSEPGRRPQYAIEVLEVTLHLAGPLNKINIIQPPGFTTFPSSAST